MNKRIIKALLAGLMVLALIIAPAMAAEGSCSLTLSFLPEEAPAVGVSFQLYRVGTVDKASVTFAPLETLPEQYQNILRNTDASWLTRASTLAGYVRRDRMEPTTTAVTDENGTFQVEELEDGLYLVLGDSITRGRTTYTPTPALLALPSTADGYTWVEQVEGLVKYTQRTRPTPPDPSDPDNPDQPETLQYRALKVWDDAGYEAERPESVTVDLLRDGQVYDTQTLSAANNWRYDWTGLDSEAAWEVVERETEGYTPAVELGGITFVITNTRVEDLDEHDTPLVDKPDLPDEPDPDQPDPDKPVDPVPGEDPERPTPIEDLPDDNTPKDRLPQTGVLWWPVPILAILGMVSLIAGLARRRKGA